MKQDIKLMWLCFFMWIVSLLTVIGVSFWSLYIDSSCHVSQTWLVIVQISASGVFGSAFTLWLTKIFDYKAKRQELLHDYLFKTLDYYNVLKTIKPIININDIEEIKNNYEDFNEMNLWNELQKIYVRIWFIRKESKLATLVNDINNYFKDITAKLRVTYLATRSSQFVECFQTYKEDGTKLYEIVEKRDNGLILVLKNSSETKLFPKMRELDYEITGKYNLSESLFVPTYERDLRS